ncbi:MAG: hypothetical protein FJY55_10275 [Betaproteobacteria bacterium]|nr:hypothetical protein [Betaproteobacteria bacterium]
MKRSKRSASRSRSGRAVVSRSSKREFRTSVILTETQFKRVREVARENDASIAWVLRQAVDRYLETPSAGSAQQRGKPQGKTKER